VDQLKRHRRIVSARVGRLAIVAVAGGALCVSVTSMGPVGASTHHSSKFTIVETAKFGKVLSDGDTVYTLKPDSTACTKKCWTYWPPVVLPAGVKHPKVGRGVKASKLGTRTVHGVGRQVTYDGHLLYWYYRDKAPGQVKGNVTDTWGQWSPVFLSKSHPHPGSTPLPHTGSTSGSTPGSGGVSF
jgi:predicted lipoprotein with Yx(FWY)xxD motif